MKAPDAVLAPALRPSRVGLRWGAYFELTKPRVVLLIVFTAVVGMLLATPSPASPQVILLATLGIALAAGSAAAFNHVLDRRADGIMARTRGRPLPRHQLSATGAVVFAASLAGLSTAILAFGTNALTAVLTLFALVGYSVVYTVFLKPLTPQNIVIGGAAGAAPPVLGWTAVTGALSPEAMTLFMIIFIWTPPHFWSLALYRETEYAKAGIPMLPVTHGSAYTRKSILAYTLVLSVVALLPYATGLSGLLYAMGATALNFRFIAYAWRLHQKYSDALARQTFRFSIHYLAALFGLLLIDHFGSAMLEAVTTLFFTMLL